MTQLPDNEQLIEATFSGQLGVGLGMIALCVFIHGMGLFTLQRIMHAKAIEERLDKCEALSFSGALFTLMTVFALIFVHLTEIWLFAFLYDYLGALPDFEESLYFSTISYSTIGYSDTSIVEDWRMIAALEGILGVIMLGWSTAFFVRILGRLEGELYDPAPRATSED
jgi:hypothetical protein